MAQITLTTIDFHGARLILAPGETPDTTLVAMKPVAEDIGLDWASQFTKIKKHPILSKGIVEFTIPSAGGPQAMMALPLTRLNFWLATIQPNKIRDQVIRAKVIEYQTECADVLFNHFFGKALARSDIFTDKKLGGIVKAVVSKQLEARIAPVERAVHELAKIVQDLVTASDARRAVEEFMSVRQLLDELKVPSRKRDGLNRRLGYRLQQHCALHDVAAKRCPHTRVWLYPVTVAREVAKAQHHLVKEHLDRLNGQGRLRLVRSDKDKSH